MSTVRRFDNCKLCIYGGEHNPPHFHLRAADWSASFTISGCSLLAGEYVRKDADEALTWASANTALLLQVWIETNERDD